MRRRVLIVAGLLAGLLAGEAAAQTRWRRPPDCPPPAPPCCPPTLPPAPAPEPGKEPGAPPAEPEPGAPSPPEGVDLATPFAQAPEAGAQPAASFNPNVFGDQGPLAVVIPPLVATLPTGARVGLRPGQVLRFPAGTTFSRPVVIASQTLPTGLPPGTVLPAGTPLPGPLEVTAGEVVEVPSGNLPVNVIRGAYKAAENNSPRPTDRVVFNYNYYANVNTFLLPPGVSPTAVHRYTAAVEKTFLGGDASVELRLPFLQITGDPSIEKDSFGDLSVVLKYALVNEPVRAGYAGEVLYGGDVLSGGLVVTAPTGGRAAFSSREDDIHPWVVQPWAGGVRNFGPWYVQGFSSVAVPTDSRDTTYWFNSLQLGWFAYRNYESPKWLKMLVPIAEVHVNTPLNNRGVFTVPVGARDIVNLNGGLALGLGRRSVVNLAVSVPVTGPKPYDVEALAQVNFLY